MDYTHEVFLTDGRGSIKCYGAVPAKSGNSHRILLHVCHYHKGTCSCGYELSIISNYIEKIVQLVNQTAEPVIPKKKRKLNTAPQDYKGIQLQLIERGGYQHQAAKRFTVGTTNQNVWIPNKHLEDDGTIINGENIDYVFRQATRQLEIAGYTGPIPGIKRQTTRKE